MAGQHHHGLQRVQSFLRDFHKFSDFAINTTNLLDFIDLHTMHADDPSSGSEILESTLY
jgi:hypothetical protein